jgi:hypothetical protein
MRAVTTIFLDNSLRAILDHIEQTPDLNPDLPGLVEFKNTLIQRVQQIRDQEPAATLKRNGGCSV